MPVRNIRADFPDKFWWPASRKPPTGLTVLLALRHENYDKPTITLGYYEDGWQYAIPLTNVEVYAYLELPPAPDPDIFD